MMAVGAGLVVAMILARRHFAHPVEHAPNIDPAPAFVDGDAESDRDVERERRVIPMKTGSCLEPVEVARGRFPKRPPPRSSGDRP